MTIIFILLISIVAPFSATASDLSREYPFVELGKTPDIVPGFGGAVDMGGTRDPELVLADGVVRMYYTAIDGSGRKRIALASSTDLATWNFEGVVWDAESGGSFNRFGVSSPSVIRDGLGYALYYTAEGRGFCSIGKAVSADGVHFSQEGELTQPVLSPSGQETAFDRIGVGRPSVIDYNGVYLMMYQGFDGGKWRRLGAAISMDGTTFFKIKGNAGGGAVFGRGPHGFDDAGAMEPAVQLADGRLRLFYTSLHY